MDRTSRSRGPPGPPPRDQPRYHYSSSHHRMQKQSASTNQSSNGSTKQSGSEKNPFFTPTPTPSPSPKPSERQSRKRRYHEMNHHQSHHSQPTTRQPVSYNHPPANPPIHHSGHPPTKRFRHGITPNTSHTIIPQQPHQPVVTVKITNTHQFKAGLQNFQNTNGIHSTSINHNVPRSNHRGGGHNQYQTRHYQNQNIHQNVHQNVHGNVHRNVHRNNHQNQTNTRGRGRGGHGGKSYADIQNRRREVETDFHRITQRMRQIDIGKNTPEYKHYIATVPRHMRSRNIKEHPRTPNPREKMPNKWWKAALKNWRKSLHKYDPPPMALTPANGATHSHGLNNRNGGNGVNKVDDGFCCEKCSLSLPTFEKWQLHRADCDGKKLAEIQPPPPPPKKPNKAAKAPKVSDPRRAGHGTVKREREWNPDIRNVERGNRAKETKPVIKEEEKRVESEKESENEDDDLDSLSDIESEPEEEPVKMKKEATSYLVDEYAIPETNTKSNAQSAGLLDQLDSILNDSDSDGDW